MTDRSSTVRWTAAALATALALAGPATAQTGGKGFLFGEPRGSFSIRGGLAAASAGGDLFGEARNLLTLDRGDLVGGAVAADLGIAFPGARLELVLGAALSETSAGSEYRDWVEEGPTPASDDDVPIRQTTSFERRAATAGLKAYLTPRGRSIGRFAWVPNRLAPYVGAGGGVTWYSFRQEGDFVDVETTVVSGDMLESSGWGPTAYVGGGLDFTLSNHVALTADARYQYGRVRPGSPFEGYENLDLSGVMTTFGFNFRF